MLIFTGKDDRLVIPLERVYNIVTNGCRVVINYDCGDAIYEGQKISRIETVGINFDSGDEVDKVMRQFYKACNNKVGAFYFGA